MFLFKENNIKKTILVCSITLVALLSIAFGGFYITEKYLNLEQELPLIEQNFLNQQQQLLKSIVDLQVQQIDFRRKQIQARLQETLTTRVYEAKAIAKNLYEKNIEDHGLDSIRLMTREALRPIRFDNNQGYFFAQSMDGVIQLYPPNQQYENHKADVLGSQGAETYQQMTTLIREKNEGFIEYNWPLPGGNSEVREKKVSYLAIIEPLNWFVGSGHYLTDFVSMTKQEITDDIRNNMGANPLNYFFVYQLHNIEGGKNFATMLINPNRPDLIGKHLSDDYKDAHGKEFRKEFLQGLRQNGEAFVTYWYKKPGAVIPKKKLSFFKLYPEWNWVVAKGIYLDELDTIIAGKKAKLEHQVKKQLFAFSFFFLLAVVVILVVAHYFTRGINAILDDYKKTQKRQQEKLEHINSVLHKQAMTDNLTGLYNRQFFNKLLGKEIAGSRRYQSPLSLILFDIDRFKLINDTLGHLNGDKVLRELAMLIRNRVRESDALARWGGEEFALLVPENDLNQTIVLARMICTLVSSHNFSIDRVVTCSFGVAQLQPEESAGDFINRADQALYNAKEAGRNTVKAL